MNRKTLIAIVSIIAFGVGIAGGMFIFPGAGPAPKKKKKELPEEPVTLGILTQQSGIFAPSGMAGLHAAQIWKDWTNEKGGILGRKVKFEVRDTSVGKEKTIDSFIRLTEEKKVAAIFGTESTSTGLAVGKKAEEMNQLWLSWDGTTQKGLKLTMEEHTYSFPSTFNESEAVAGAVLTARKFPNVETVAGLNDDYSYGHNNWKAYISVLKKMNPDVEKSVSLFSPYGTSNFVPYIEKIKAANPDLLMCSFWAGHATTFLKQAADANLWENIKGVMVTAGGVLPTLKKEFVPEGLIIGCNSWYFEAPKGWPLAKKFTEEYLDRYDTYPVYECDHAFFTLQAYKKAVEKAYTEGEGWPTKEEIAKELKNISVRSLSGWRGYREDGYMSADFYQGISHHSENYDFVTLQPRQKISSSLIQHPPGMSFQEWVEQW